MGNKPSRIPLIVGFGPDGEKISAADPPPYYTISYQKDVDTFFSPTASNYVINHPAANPSISGVALPQENVSTRIFAKPCCSSNAVCLKYSI